MPQSFTLTAYLVKLFLRTELSVVPVGSTFFSDQKSRGFHIHKCHVSDPARLTRILIAACLAYIWMIYLGTLTLATGLVATIHRSDRCDLSLFQLGLDHLEYCLNQALEIHFELVLPNKYLLD